MTHAATFGLVIAGAAAAALALLPTPNDPAMHHYADTRTWVGIPNAGDVLSNIPFVLIGLWGLIRLRLVDAANAEPIAVFFAAVIAVGLGSAFYHWAPTNVSLAWDRLPMAIAFMALLTAMVADRLSTEFSRRWLWPLVTVGAASVVLWRATGNIWPYALVQLAPILSAAALCVIPQAASHAFSRPILVGLLMFYGGAKAVEEADIAVWRALDELLSGHSLKHLLAAGAAALVVQAIRAKPQT